MDVCTELAVSCGGHSSCVNSPDSEEGYNCVCDSGYRQDGNSCSVIGTVYIIIKGEFVLAQLAQGLYILGTCVMIGNTSVQTWLTTVQKKGKILQNYRTLISPYVILIKWFVPHVAMLQSRTTGNTTTCINNANSIHWGRNLKLIWGYVPKWANMRSQYSMMTAGIVHVYWVGGVVLLLLSLVLIGVFFRLRHKYLQNK